MLKFAVNNQTAIPMFNIKLLLIGLILFSLISSKLMAQISNKVEFSALPEPVTNNAITIVEKKGERYLVSFSGLGAKKSSSDVHNKTFVYRFNENKWSQGKNVPMSIKVVDSGAKPNKNDELPLLTGRLASIATSIGDLAYVFGGYTVAKNHVEVSVPDVYSYDVIKDEYTLLTPMPVPVDDSVALTYQNRFIYLVSGWHNDGNVNLVQVFDTQKNTWSQATPFPGAPVFGHAGGIVGNEMLICDGVKVRFHKNKRRDFTSEPACYLGSIKEGNINKIDWRIVEHPTGDARYRMASVGSVHKNQIVFVGGSENPYNYDGVGYNGKPSEPTTSMWRFDLKTKQWILSKTEYSTMDHRGLIELDGKYITVGGMSANQQVMDQVVVH